MVEAIRFKFKLVNHNGNEGSILSKKGTFDSDHVTLDGEAIPIGVIVKANLRFKRLILTLPAEDRQFSAIVLAFTGGSAKTLHSAINMLASERQDRMHLEHLEKNNSDAECRIETCPYCKSTIDLTDRDPSLQIYCLFCDSIVTIEGKVPPDEAHYHHCDQWNLYDQPKGFTVFYFYFLFVVYGWHYRQVCMCNTCIRSEAWQMLFGNLLFVLGVPMAIVQLICAYVGGSTFSQAFDGLDKANAMAKRSKVESAENIFGRILQRVGACAGVRFNYGLGLIAAKRHEEAVTQFELALRDCANYSMAAEALAGCYQQMGRVNDAERLHAQRNVRNRIAPSAKTMQGSHQRHIG